MSLWKRVSGAELLTTQEHAYNTVSNSKVYTVPGTHVFLSHTLRPKKCSVRSQRSLETHCNKAVFYTFLHIYFLKLGEQLKGKVTCGCGELFQTRSVRDWNQGSKLTFLNSVIQRPFMHLWGTIEYIPSLLLVLVSSYIHGFSSIDFLAPSFYLVLSYISHKMLGLAGRWCSPSLFL